MSDLKKFIDSVKNTSKGLELRSSSVELVTAISSNDLSLVTTKISPSERDKFANEVTDLAYSEDILTKLSDTVGKPKDMESEDEFVSRAKKSFTDILRKKLFK